MSRSTRTIMTALCAAFALAGASEAAPKSAAQLKREQEREAARAKTLKTQAAAARRDEAELAKALSSLRSEEEQAKTAVIDAEAQAAALEARRLAEQAQLARERRTLDATLIALLQQQAAMRGAPPSLTDARAVRLASYAGPPLAGSAAARHRSVEETLQLRLALNAERDEIEARRQALAAEEADKQAKLAETAKRRAALQAASDAAAKKAAALGREAKTLAELSAKVRAEAQAKAAKLQGGTKALAKIDTGPRRSPAAGRILVSYGAATKDGPAKGMTLRTAAGATVVAPGGGSVGYAGEFRSYGNVVIIDQADGSSIVLTGLHSVLARPGKKVSVGEAVGQMSTASASPAPDLYFEVREAGRTVDPERWLRAKM